jgi:hypothetical protein
LEAADEFVVSFRDRRAAPAEILEAFAGSGIEVLAHSLYSRGHGDIALLLVTADSLHTALVLRLLGLNYDIEPVVLGRLPRSPGNAALLGMRLAKSGVRIQYSYVSWPGGDSLFAVFKTDHDPHALAVHAA